MNTYSIYGYCPICGAEGDTRERRPNGNDTCKNGHTYPTSDRLSTLNGLTTLETICMMHEQMKLLSQRLDELSEQGTAKIEELMQENERLRKLLDDRA